MNGYFEFYNSSIYNNYAINNPVGEILDSANLWILSSVAVYGNQALTVSDISTEFIIKWNYLWFVTSNFISYANTNNLLIASTLNASLVQLILSSLSIQVGSSIKNQDILFNIFLSALSISNSQLLNLKSNIQMSSSNLTIENTQITNVTNIAGTDFIFANLDSILTVNSSSFSNSSSSFMNLRSSQVMISNLTLTNIASPSLLSQIVSSTKAEMSSINVVNWTASNGIFFDFETSSNLSLSGFAGSQAKSWFLQILGTNVTQINSFAIDYVNQPLIVKSSIINVISNSSFTNNGNSTLKAGGAISMSDSKISIINSKFINNIAISGGAISFECTSLDSCNLNINTTTFSSNRATSQGGAIYYNYNRPTISNTIFSNNNAYYGYDFASYAVRVVMDGNMNPEMTIFNAASGIQYDQEVKFSLIDYYNQTMSLNSVNQITINPVNKTAVSMKGTNSGLLRNGVATFNNLIFNTQPGSTNIQFIASSKAIDSVKVKEVYGSVSNNLISVNFRFCKPGEIQLSDNTCSTWATGTFSLDWNSTECEPCPSNAQWLGGNQISVSAGYWRMSQNTSKIVEWIYDKAWDGGYVDQENAPVNWATGYTGILWNEWQIANGIKYSKVSDFECSKWPSPVYNAIRVAGLAILVFAFIFLITFVNIHKTQESQFSILLRILTNYLQLISSMMLFNIKFPIAVSNVFSPMTNLGETSSVFLSFDWFVSDLEIKGPFPSNAIFKVALSGVLPIILLLIFTIIWAWVKLTCNKLAPDFRRNVMISFISIVFLLYTRLVQSTFNMFGWALIDSNDNRSKIHLEDSWYGTSHIKILLFVAVPIILVWVISMPLIALFLLFKNYNKQENNKVKQYFLILYQGLKPNAYYWEFVNTLRKVLILMLFNIMYFFSQPIKILLCSLLLVASIRIQKYIKPYKVDANNMIELRAIIAGIWTITAGIIFIQDYQFALFNFLCLLAIIIINLWFILEWTYMLLVCIQSKWYIIKFVSLSANFNKIYS